MTNLTPHFTTDLRHWLIHGYTSVIIHLSWYFWCHVIKISTHITVKDDNVSKTSCAGGRHNMPSPFASWPLTFWLESGVQVTCEVSNLCANFNLPRPLCSRLRPDVRDRQTDVGCTSSLNAFALWKRGYNKFVLIAFGQTRFILNVIILSPFILQTVITEQQMLSFEAEERKNATLNFICILICISYVCYRIEFCNGLL